MEQRTEELSFTIDNRNLFVESQSEKSGLGAVSWATLEMLRRGGMPEDEVKQLHEKMKQYFAVPTNEECNTILRVVEARLKEDGESQGIWY